MDSRRSVEGAWNEWQVGMIERGDRAREHRLSIIIPVYNEAATIETVLETVRKVAVPIPREIIMVDDGSRDGSGAILDRLAAAHAADGVRVLHHPRNRGKGAGVRTALEAATGTIMLIQDADLEYNPHDYSALLAPILEGRAQIVFGSRAFFSHTAFSFWFVMGNKLVTLVTNMLFNSYISDVETCYKVLPVDLARSLNLESRGFEIEVEIAAKVLRAGHRIYEVPIEYAARTRAEGKKLNWQDGLKAVRGLVRYRLRP
ncbi:MAG: glycosyltransferase family 2 protein [Chloroflexota bacterium]